MISIVTALLFLVSSASAQQVSPEQICRNISAVLAQENARLGAENEQLKKQLAEMSKPAPKDAPKE